MERDRYVDISRAVLFNSRNSFVAWALPKKSIKLLDVGNLGDGPINVSVAEIVKANNGEYFGLDCNAPLAKEINHNNQLVGDLQTRNDAIADSSFDVIYAGQIIEHSWTPGLMIKECNRIVKNEGLLILDTPNVFSLDNILRVFLYKKDTMGDVTRLTYHETIDNFAKIRNEKVLESQPQHKIFYSPAMLRQLLNMHGFQIVKWAYIGKPRNIFHRFMLKLFPQCSQKVGVVAIKQGINDIFGLDS